MGLMLDALKQIEVRTTAPVILPMPREEELPTLDVGTFDEAAAAKADSADEQSACTAASVAFDEQALHASSSQDRPLAWPRTAAEHVSHYAKTAETILHQLFQASGSSNPSRPSAVVAFTSAGDGDGKTSVLAGVAPQLAEMLAAGLLVVDASDHKPDLTRRLGLQSGQEPEAAPAVIRRTTLPGLNFLPASTLPKSLSWIEDLRLAWPLVLLDTPSMAHREVGPLLRCCDGVYLVVRLGYTSRRTVRRVNREISRTGGKLLGAIAVV